MPIRFRVGLGAGDPVEGRRGHDESGHRSIGLNGLANHDTHVLAASRGRLEQAGLDTAVPADRLVDEVELVLEVAVELVAGSVHRPDAVRADLHRARLVRRANVGLQVSGRRGRAGRYRQREGKRTR